MKGVIIPEVSAGSNQVGASDTWTAYVIWPSGAPAARPVSPAMATTSARVASRNERTRVMKVSLGAPEWDGAERRDYLQTSTIVNDS